MVRQDIQLAKRQDGFTLVELLVAIAMFAMIMIGIFYLWRGDQMAYLQGSAAAVTQQDARAAMEQLAREIRLAGYDPCRYVQQNPAPAGGTLCSDPGANVLNTRSAFDPVRPNVFSIVTAANSIQVRMDRDPNGDTAGADENITFTYDGGGQRLLRNRNDGSGDQELAQNITSFQLQYFNAAGGAVASGGGSANDLNIRLVRITLTATAPQTFLGSAVTLQSDVRLRDR